MLSNIFPPAVFVIALVCNNEGVGVWYFIRVGARNVNNGVRTKLKECVPRSEPA